MKRKNNIGYILFAFMISALPCLWPQAISKAQAPMAKSEIIVSKVVDSLNEEKNKSLDSAIKVANTLPAMSQTLRTIRRQKAIAIKTIYLHPEIYIRYNGEIFECEPERYEGFVIIDCDRFTSGIDTGYSIPNEFIDTVTIEPEPPKKRNWFQRLFNK
jgi:hypothetical protein